MTNDRIAIDILGQRMSIDTLQTGIDESAFIQFSHQGHHTTGATELLNAVFLTVGGQFDEEGCLA